MSDDNVIPLGCVTTNVIDPDKILEAAKGKLDVVLIAGRTKEGKLFFASSESDAGTILFYAEAAAARILSDTLEVMK